MGLGGVEHPLPQRGVGVVRIVEIVRDDDGRARAARAQLAIRPGISAGGEAMTARSAVSGRSETERYANTPCTAVSRACTGITGPSNSPRNRFCANTRPIERGAPSAPNSAIEPGRNRNSRLRTDTPIPRSGRTIAGAGFPILAYLRRLRKDRERRAEPSPKCRFAASANLLQNSTPRLSRPPPAASISTCQ